MSTFSNDSASIPPVNPTPAFPAPLPEGGAGGGSLDYGSHQDHHTSSPSPEPPRLRASLPSSFRPFHPTTEAASDILCALSDPNETLREIAHRFHTTIDVLAEWLDTPPIQKRIEQMKRLAATRDELVLAANKRLALDVLVSILEAHQHDEQHIPVDPQNLKAVTQRDRRRAAARIAANELIRLANKTPAAQGGDRERVRSSQESQGAAGPEGRDTPTPDHGLKPMATRARRSGENHSKQSRGNKHKTKHNLSRPASPNPFHASRNRHNFGGLLPSDLLAACGRSISGSPLFGRPLGAWIDGAA